MSWVLRDGKHYFREMVAIGPRCTPDRRLAARFKTKEAAMSVALSFHHMCFEPEIYSLRAAGSGRTKG